MVVPLPPHGPITPHLLLDSTNQMLTTPSRSSIFYFGLGNLLSYLCHRSTLLYYSTIIYFVVFFETLFTYTSYMCCTFSIFQYIHHPSASLTQSPNPSSCPSVVLMSCSFCSLGVKILASWPLICATVSKSYITAGTMIPSCKKIAANHPLHSSLPIPPCQHSLLHLSCGLFLDLHGWPQLFNLNLLIHPPTTTWKAQLGAIHEWFLHLAHSSLGHWYLSFLLYTQLFIFFPHVVTSLQKL